MSQLIVREGDRATTCTRCGIDREKQWSRTSGVCCDCYDTVRREGSTRALCLSEGCRRTAREDGLCRWCHMQAAPDHESPLDISGWHSRVIGGVRRWIEVES